MVFSLLLLFAGKGVNAGTPAAQRYYWISGIIYRTGGTPPYRYYWINGVIYRIQTGSPPTYSPSYDFSDSRNSQYLSGGGV